MDVRRLDLGLLDALRAEAFGEPGQRTFRLRAETDAGHVNVWLEKQQIVALVTALSELLERIRAPLGSEPQAETSADFVGELDVRAGAMQIGFDTESQGFMVEVGEFASALDITNISFVASRDQIAAVQEQLEEIVGQSRPRCPLCGTPLTGEPHFCPPSNGHTHVALDE